MFIILMKQNRGVAGWGRNSVSDNTQDLVKGKQRDYYQVRTKNIFTR